MARIVVCLFISLSLPQLAFALSGKGTTAATFLKIGIGPRAVGMAESFVAVADDASAVYWNPAGLANLPLPELTGMHVFWIEDIYFDHLGGALPIQTGVLGASLVYLNHGQLKRSQAEDTPDDPDRGTFSVVDFGFTGAYAYPFTPVMSLGAALKLFSESIDTQASLGWAVDLGFHYKLPWEGITLGALVQHLGPATRVEEEYFRMPINFKLGLSWKPYPELLLAMDYNQLLEQYGKISLGAEYIFENSIALRAGYHYQEKIDPSELYADFGTNALSGLTAGVGVMYGELTLDYAFAPYGFLGAAHRLALTYRFSETPAIAPPPQKTQPIPQPSVPVQTPLEQELQVLADRISRQELPEIQFLGDTAQLKSASFSTLDALADVMRKQPQRSVRIEGHTRQLSAADDNLLLSQRQVDAVKTYLVSRRNINPRRVITVGYGEKQWPSEPAASPASPTQRIDFKAQ